MILCFAKEFSIGKKIKVVSKHRKIYSGSLVIKQMLVRVRVRSSFLTNAIDLDGAV